MVQLYILVYRKMSYMYFTRIGMPGKENWFSYILVYRKVVATCTVLVGMPREQVWVY